MKRGTPLDPSTSALRLADGVDLHRTPEGLVRLVGAPIQPWGPLRILAWLMRVPKRGEVELDTIGTWVIDRIDEYRLDELAVALAAHLKLSRREAETALADFTRMLLRRQLVAVVDAVDHARSASVSQRADRRHAPAPLSDLNPHMTAP